MVDSGENEEKARIMQAEKTWAETNVDQEIARIMQVGKTWAEMVDSGGNEDKDKDDKDECVDMDDDNMECTNESGLECVKMEKHEKDESQYDETECVDMDDDNMESIKVVVAGNGRPTFNIPQSNKSATWTKMEKHIESWNMSDEVEKCELEIEES